MYAMNWNTVIYLLPFIVSLTISGIVCVMAWQSKSTGSRTFAWLAFMEVLWTLGYICELLVLDLKAKIFWDQIQWFWTAIIPITFFDFVLQYTQRKNTLHKGVQKVLYLPIVAFMLLVLTNQQHGFIIANAKLVSAEPFPILFYEFTSVIIWFSLYFMSLTVAGIALLTFFFFESHFFQRIHTTAVVIGATLPLMGNILSLAGLLPDAIQRDISPFTFAIGNIFILWGITKFNFLRLSPLARGFVFENMSLGCILLDSAGQILDINNSAASIMGVSPRAVLGQQIGSLFSSSREFLERIGQGGEFSFELPRVIGGQKKWYTVQISPLYDQVKQNLGQLITLQDNSYLKKLEKETQRSAKRYKELVDSASDIIFTTDPKGWVTFANNVASRAIGLDENSLGGNHFDLIPPEWRQRVRRFYIQQVRSRQEQTYLEIPIISKDGRTLWFGQNVKLIWEGKNFQGYFVIARDITERKQAEEGLRRYSDNMEVLNQVGLQLMGEGEQEQIYVNIHVAAQKIIPHDVFLIAILDKASQEVEYSYLWDEGRRFPAERSPASPNLTTFVIGSCKPLRINEWGEPDTLKTKSELFGNPVRDTRSVLAAPLLDGQGRSFGMISAQSYAPGVYTLEHETFLVSLANLLSKTIENTRLFGALRESEERFRLVSQATLHAIWDWDLQSNRIWWGAGLTSMWLYSAESISMEPEWRWAQIHPEDRAKVKKSINTGWENGLKFWSREYRFQRADGTFSIVFDRAHILYDQNGKANRMLGAMMDITQSKEIERELIKGERKYRSIFERVEDVIYETDFHGILTNISPSVERYIGKSAQELIGQHVENLFANPSDYAALDQEIISRGRLADYEIGIRGKNGKILIGSFNASILFDEQGQPIGTQGIARDITARKQLQEQSAVFASQLESQVRQRTEELQSTNEFLESLLSTSAIVNANLDQELVLDHILQEARRLMPCRAINIMLIRDDYAYIARRIGYEGLENIERNLLQFRFPLTWHSFKQMIDTGEPIQISDTAEFTRWQNIRSSEWARSYVGVPLRTGGKTLGFINASHDSPNFFLPRHVSMLQALGTQVATAVNNAKLLREMKVLLEEEQVMRDRLAHADKLATLGKMVAVLAHEINNPIQTIKNTLFLLDDQVFDPVYKQVLEIAQLETIRIAKLISNLRDAYRPREKELSLVNIIEVLGEVEIILAPQMGKSKVRWEISTSTQPYTVMADRDGLKQVFINLGMNAVEALEETGGGRIIININIHGDGDRLGVAMQNFGPLIPEPILNNIFDPFFSTKGGKGTGLGLSISQDIIREFGGEITVESTIEHGVIFTVWFPMAGDVLKRKGGHDATKKHSNRG